MVTSPHGAVFFRSARNAELFQWLSWFSVRIVLTTCLIHRHPSCTSKGLRKSTPAMNSRLLESTNFLWHPTEISRSEVGGKRVCKDRAPQPGGRLVPSMRACALCYSCRISDEMRVLAPSLFPFGLGGISVPFSLQDLSVRACLSKSE